MINLQKLFQSNINDISDGYHTFGELYNVRCSLNAALFNTLHIHTNTPVIKSKNHYDGSPCFDGTWFIVMAQLSSGQISFHYPLSEWDKFNIPEIENGWEWDEHNTQECCERLFEM